MKNLSKVTKTLQKARQRVERAGDSLDLAISLAEEAEANSSDAAMQTLKEDLKFLTKKHNLAEERLEDYRLTIRGLHDYLGEVTDLLVKHGLSNHLSLPRVQKLYPKKLMKKFSKEEERHNRSLGELKALMLSN